MGKCSVFLQLLFSVLGILFGFSAFIVFFFIYHNVVAGTWAFFSGVMAAVCFQLIYLKWIHRITDYYTSDALSQLSCLGMFSGVISGAFFFSYLFYTLYEHIPMVPVSDSSAIVAVWCFMTSKWGFTLYLISSHMRRQMMLGYAPLA